MTPIVCGFCVWFLLCNAPLSVNSCFAIIFAEEREAGCFALIVLLFGVLCLFHTVTWVGLRSLIVLLFGVLCLFHTVTWVGLRSLIVLLFGVLCLFS